MGQHSPRPHEPLPDRPAPAWLAQRLHRAGGSVPFPTYMDWVLHDPEHGAYGAGHLRIGPRGDFVTSPSLGADFAALLAPQIAAWLLENGSAAALVEAGPGEGTLARQLTEALVAGWPELAHRLELVLVEPNPGMAERQRRQLRDAPLPVRWTRFEDLAREPVEGVVLAHEVLDALPLERIERRGAGWCRQRVALRDGGLRLEAGEALPRDTDARLTALGLLPPGAERPEGWCTELHPGLTPWLAACGRGLRRGHLLVIDYALEARRYYAPSRRGGTLLAYRGQQATGDPLLEPGRWDLTAHLCLESLADAARTTGWRWVGQRRQGEALLALGLAQRLHGLQQEQNGRSDLATLLSRREALLRLVDPAGLGDFRWIALQRGGSGGSGASDAAGPVQASALPLFLLDPPLSGGPPAPGGSPPR